MKGKNKKKTEKEDKTDQEGKIETVMRKQYVWVTRLDGIYT